MTFTPDDQQAVHVRFLQKQWRHAKRVVAQPDGHSRIEHEEQAAVDLTQVTFRNASKKGKISRQLTAAGAVHATVTCPTSTSGNLALSVPLHFNMAPLVHPDRHSKNSLKKKWNL